MSILLIILGSVIWRFGAVIFFVGEARGGQNAGTGILTLAIQLSGMGLIIWGVVRLFS
ncbi:MAG: hypothetical protein Q7T27_00315 [Pseudomonas sp.]|uniref:hypothetical protein n=1 Tax=Pseudomonas sp. TaxID=306 RepID=UPI002719394F|nr:hypothetical protein [Pseudomonas sp.]MDO8401913.1 hypothetical protein [Pseudomonas sp.]